MTYARQVIAVFVLLAALSSAQTKSQCNALLKSNAIQYAGTKDETINSVTICDDGQITALYSFTAPAFGDAKEKPTKWEYSGQIHKDTTSDVRKVVTRRDVGRLPENVDVPKAKSPLDVLMCITVVDQGSQRNITLKAPPFTCAQGPAEMPQPAWVWMCMFTDLYNRAKQGAPPQHTCGCQSLHEMATVQ